MQVYRRLLLTPLVLFCLVSPSHADMTPEPVISVVTDDAPDTSYLDIIRTDEGALKGISYRQQSGKIKTVFVADLEQGAQPLKTIGDHNVIMLAKEADLDPYKGGHVIVKFLYDGATNAYLDFRINVEVQKKILFFSDPNDNDPRSDHNPYTSIFNHLMMKKRTILGKEIGIKEVIPSWQYE